MCHRVGRHALALKDKSKVVVRQGVIRPEREGTFVLCCRVGEPAEILEDIAKIIVIESNVITERDRLADQVDRCRMAASLKGDEPEEMQAVGVPCIDRQDLPAKLFGLDQPSRLMAAKSFGQQDLQGRGRQRRRSSARLIALGAILIAVRRFDQPPPSL
jgi:hypothetical protein